MVGPRARSRPPRARRYTSGGRLIGTVLVLNVFIARTPLMMWLRPGRRGTVAAHVLFGIEEGAATSTPNVASAVAPVLLHDAVDAGGIPGGRGGRRPPPPEAHAENRALRARKKGRSISDPRST